MSHDSRLERLEAVFGDRRDDPEPLDARIAETALAVLNNVPGTPGWDHRRGIDPVRERAVLAVVDELLAVPPDRLDEACAEVLARNRNVSIDP